MKFYKNKIENNKPVKDHLFLNLQILKISANKF